MQEGCTRDDEAPLSLNAYAMCSLRSACHSAFLAAKTSVPAQHGARIIHLACLLPQQDMSVSADLKLRLKTAS